MMSPSPRREWIEMSAGCFLYSAKALSPSPRREWIEIRETKFSFLLLTSLPPHGGSGLKSAMVAVLKSSHNESPSPRREWIEIHDPIS